MFKTFVVTPNPTLGELKVFKQFARALEQSTDLKEIKRIRDAAEAARRYACSAKLGRRIQNRAAELKLRAERRAGGLLLDLKLRGADRKSNSHDESLKLADFGVERNQSARWQREAAVPDTVFEAYVAEANASGEEITAKGLLRLARTAPAERSDRRRRRKPKAANGANGHGISSDKSGRSMHCNVTERGFRSQSGPGDGAAIELVEELRNHHGLLANLFKSTREGLQEKLNVAQRRLISRLLADSERLLARLKTLLRDSAEG